MNTEVNHKRQKKNCVGEIINLSTYWNVNFNHQISIFKMTSNLIFTFTDLKFLIEKKRNFLLYKLQLQYFERKIQCKRHKRNIAEYRRYTRKQRQKYWNWAGRDREIFQTLFLQNSLINELLKFYVNLVPIHDRVFMLKKGKLAILLKKMWLSI